MSYPEPGNNLNALQSKNGERKCDTFAQWSTTQQRKITTFLILKANGARKHHIECGNPDPERKMLIVLSHLAPSSNLQLENIPCSNRRNQKSTTGNCQGRGVGNQSGREEQDIIDLIENREGGAQIRKGR